MAYSMRLCFFHVSLSRLIWTVYGSANFSNPRLLSAIPWHLLRSIHSVFLPSLSSAVVTTFSSSVSRLWRDMLEPGMHVPVMTTYCHSAESYSLGCKSVLLVILMCCIGNTLGIFDSWISIVRFLHFEVTCSEVCTLVFFYIHHARREFSSHVYILHVKV